MGERCPAASGQAGRKHETLATNTLFGAEPSIPTALSTFVRKRLYYRGQDAVTLAGPPRWKRWRICSGTREQASRSFPPSTVSVGEPGRAGGVQHAGHAGGHGPLHAWAHDAGAASGSAGAGGPVGERLRRAGGAAALHLRLRRGGSSPRRWRIWCGPRWCCWWTTS